MKDRDGENFVTDDNTGGFYVCECGECGYIFNSKNSAGGEPIADAGDHGDCYCPKCGAIEPPEAENVNSVWNAQQSRINKMGRGLCVPVDQRNGRPRITNEMKAECIGEWSVQTMQVCPTCDEDHPVEDCEICGGKYEDWLKLDIPWTTCKEIYKRMAEVAAKSS